MPDMLDEEALVRWILALPVRAEVVRERLQGPGVNVYFLRFDDRDRPNRLCMDATFARLLAVKQMLSELGLDCKDWPHPPVGHPRPGTCHIALYFGLTAAGWAEGMFA
jgi:hypothetical protein